MDYFTEIFLNKINDLVVNFASLAKKISKYKLKFQSKPWIIPCLQKSISVQNKSSTRLQKNDPTINVEFHLRYKNYRSLISTLFKRSKQNYYKKYLSVI